MHLCLYVAKDFVGEKFTYLYIGILTKFCSEAVKIFMVTLPICMSVSS